MLSVAEIFPCLYSYHIETIKNIVLISAVNLHEIAIRSIHKKINLEFLLEIILSYFLGNNQQYRRKSN